MNKKIPPPRIYNFFKKDNFSYNDINESIERMYMHLHMFLSQEQCDIDHLITFYYYTIVENTVTGEYATCTKLYECSVSALS